MIVSLLINNMDALSGQVTGNRAVGTSDQVSAQVSNQQAKVLMGNVAILWDIENCPVPAEVRAEDVAGNIRVALRLHPVIRGVVTLFSAYGDFNNFPRKLREGCQRTGVNLIDVPNGKKDAADKAILVDMFLFALDNPPPSTIFLISGDVDFAPALHKLGQRGYTVVLGIPSGVGVSSALCNAGRFVWDWPSVARGEGLIPAKSFYPRTPELTCYAVGSLSSDESDFPNDEEAIVYKGMSQNGYIVGTNSTQAYAVHTKHMAADFSLTSLAGQSAPISYIEDAARSIMPSDTNSASFLPSSQFIASTSRVMGNHPLQSSSFMQNNSPITITTAVPTYVGRSGSMSVMPSTSNSGMNSTSWVQPGDIQGLKGQIVKLISMSGGSLLLGRVPSEYHKVFGRPLYLAEYGSCKLVNLVKKMSDVICIEGKGQRKFLCLREHTNDGVNARNGKRSNTPYSSGSSDVILQDNCATRTQKSKEVKEVPSHLDASSNENVGEYGIVNVVCYSDEGTDDERASEQEGKRGDDSVKADTNTEKHDAEAKLQVFKEELQELLVSHACKILMSSLLTLYRQRYGKALDHSIFGVKDVEDLIDKVRDVAIIEEDQSTQRKFLVANCGCKSIIN